MLLFGAINSVASVASFTVILWRSFGTADIVRGCDPQGTVLDRHRLCADRVADRVSDRSSVDPVELSQRADKRRVPLRAGAAARRRGGGRPSTAASKPSARQLDTRFAAVISNYRRYVRRTLGLIGWNYTVTETILPLPYRASGAAVVRRHHQVGRRDTSPRARSARSSRDCRSSATHTVSSRATTPRSSDCTDSMEANERARELPVLTTEPSLDGSVELDGVEVRTPAGDRADRSARSATGARRVHGHHRLVGQRQDHTVAQPCRIVAGRNRSVASAGR